MGEVIWSVATKITQKCFEQKWVKRNQELAIQNQSPAPSSVVCLLKSPDALTFSIFFAN